MKLLAALRGTAPALKATVPAAVRARYAAQYLALAGGLAVLAFDAHQRLPV